MDSDVEKIKDRLSISDVVGQYVQLKRAGRNLTARCPFHKEKTPSFFVSPERGTYVCFGCGEKGDIFSFVQKMESLDFPSALKILAEKAGVKLHTTFSKEPQDKGRTERLYAAGEAAAAFYEQVLAKRADVETYLRSRGVSKETALSWRIGYAPAAWEELSKHLLSIGFSKDELVDAGLSVRSEKKQGEVFDRFRGRIMFPINDSAGRVVAFSGRFFEKVPGSKGDDEPAKYVNSPETVLFKKSRTLYGLDKARGAIRELDCILLVEGQFDVILSHQSGYPIAVALSGTALTAEHLSLMGRFSKRLVLALDADEAGIRSGLKSALMAIAAGFEVKVPTFPEGKDPADLARENPELLKAAIRTSKSAVEFFLEHFKPLARDERAYGKKVEQEVLPLIAAMHSSIEQEHYINLTARKVGVSETAVRAEVLKRPQEKSHDVKKEHSTPEEIAPFERKVGMLYYHFAEDSAEHEKLKSLLGEERLRAIVEALIPHAEVLRFKFEQEVGEHSSEQIITEDMMSDVARVIEKERYKMKFV